MMAGLAFAALWLASAVVVWGCGYSRGWRRRDAVVD